MKIYTKDNQAFVRVSKNELMCIGGVSEIEGQPEEVVAQAIRTAVAVSRFNELKPRRGISLH